MVYALEDLADKLRHLGEIDPAAKLVFEVMASRQKGLVMDVQTVAAKAKLNRFEVVRVFKALTTIGAGQFKLGRKGKESRFEAAHKPADIAAAAAVQSVAEETPQPTVDAPSQPASQSPARAPMHNLVLRMDPLIQIQVPFDITVEEAERLASLLRSLPAKAAS